MKLIDSMRNISDFSQDLNSSWMEINLLIAVTGTLNKKWKNIWHV